MTNLIDTSIRDRPVSVTSIASRADGEPGEQLLQLLNSLTINEPGVRKRPRAQLSRRTRRTSWLRFETEVGVIAIAIETVSGASVTWPAQARPLSGLPELLAATSALEPLFEALERVMGLSLTPVGLGAGPEAQARLEISTLEGKPRHRLWIAIDREVLETWSSGLRSAISGCEDPRGLHVMLSGPSAPHDELGRLQPGDVVLMPQTHLGAWPAELIERDSLGGIVGCYRPESGEFRATPVDPSSTASAPQAERILVENRTSGPGGLVTLLVRIAVSEAEVGDDGSAGMSFARILAEADVDLLCNDQVIARGQLVCLGNTHGVLVATTYDLGR